MEVPSFATPPAFLEDFAQHLHTVPERVPSARALEALLTWLEATVAAGRTPPTPFLTVALRLHYEQTRLRFPPALSEIFALVTRLKEENRGRPQAENWQGVDWLKLARLLLAQRKLPLVELFSDEPPSTTAVVRQIPLPYFARHVEKPLHPGAKRIPATALEGLFERAGQFLQAARRDIQEAQQILDSSSASAARLSRKATPSHEFCAIVAGIVQLSQ